MNWLDKLIRFLLKFQGAKVYVIADMFTPIDNPECPEIACFIFYDKKHAEEFIEANKEKYPDLKVREEWIC